MRMMLVVVVLTLSGCGPGGYENAADYHERMKARDHIGHETYDRCIAQAPFYKRKQCEER